MIYNSLAGGYLPACWLANSNVHWLHTLGQLPTHALPKRLHLIFLWAEFSQRAPITIANPILKPVLIFGGKWGAHSYLVSHKNNEETYNFQNWPPILVLTC